MTTPYNEEFIEAMRKGIQTILHEWQMPRSSTVSLLNISENATFLAEDHDSGRKIILRVHRPAYHTRQEIESELFWVESLKNEGIVATAAPLALVSGDHIAALRQGNDDRLVVGFEFLAGTEPAPENDLRDDFFTLGTITAKLHNHAKSWPIPIGFKRKVWDYQSMLGDQPLWGDWRQAIGLDAEGRRILEQTAALLRQQLAAIGKSRECFGLVHADLRLANLLVTDNELSVIDFDDCGYCWFMYDFAAAISFMEEDKQIPELQRSWVEGYRKVAALSEEDEESIPTFIMLRRLLLTAWIASHAETETAQQLGSAYTEGTVRIAENHMSTTSTFVKP